MDTFPTLYTERLILRKLEIEDIPALLEYANNKKISDYVLSIPYPYIEPDAVFRISFVWQGFKNRSRYVFAIISKEREHLVGEIGLHLDNTKVAQLGYWIGEPFWNMGIATEAIKRALTFGFDQLHLEQIYATCHVENEASGKVLLKNGMLLTGTNGNIQTYMTRKRQLS